MSNQINSNQFKYCDAPLEMDTGEEARRRAMMGAMYTRDSRSTVMRPAER